MSFAGGVALERIGDGRFRIDIDPRWRVFLGPNGGYLTALMLNAQFLALEDESRIARSLSVHFPQRALEGETEIEVSIERVGRSFSSTTARMYQQGKLCASSHCAFSVHRDGESFDETGAPEVPKPEDLPDLMIPPEVKPPFSSNFDYRPCLGSAPFTEAETAEVGGWIRPSEEEYPIDPVLLAAYSDAFIPSVFTRLSEPIAAPTIDLTVHFLGEYPLDPDWVLCRFKTPVARDGLSIEDGWMWARDGSLLARSRQLALYR